MLPYGSWGPGPRRRVRLSMTASNAPNSESFPNLEARIV